MAIDPHTGVFTWTPPSSTATTNNGNVSITIHVTDSLGLIGSQTFTAVVSANAPDATTLASIRLA
jgi:hypothetical protein